MFLNNSFGRVVDILHRSMDVSMVRRNVIADNLANADTPNFKKSTINFESELKRAFQSQKKPALELVMTHEKHISNYKPIDYRTVGPRRVLDYLSQTDANGNNVDIEEESVHMLKNQLNYQLLTQVLSNQFTQISMVTR
ncbi:MAG: flagellar basal body rod protein FlgB [Spirochaetaceae bacterium]|nr:flagellar basal body rod protein FlgB [Spirochaetaceae bacterium]